MIRGFSTINTIRVWAPIIYLDSIIILCLLRTRTSSLENCMVSKKKKISHGVSVMKRVEEVVENEADDSVSCKVQFIFSHFT